MCKSIVIHLIDDDIWERLALSPIISALHKDARLTNLLVTVSCTTSKAIAKFIEDGLSEIGVDVEVFLMEKEGELPGNLR